MILETEFQYFPARVYETKPLGTLKLKELLYAIKNPKPQIQEVFKQIQKATEQKDDQLKSKLKTENLYYFTPSVILDGKGRSYENVESYTELMVVEFDKIDFSEELKYYLFNKLNSVVAAFSSPSKAGLKLIVKIPKPKDTKEYKEYFCGLAYYLDQIEGFDTANYNPLLPMFLSWDSDILIRDNPKTWNIKGEKINTFKPLSQSELDAIPETNISEKDTESVRRIVRSMFAKITDNGHKQVISISLVLGGYVAAGYISNYEAESLLEDCINDTPYLRKSLNTYKKTSNRFLVEGQKSPLYLSKQNGKSRN